MARQKHREIFRLAVQEKPSWTLLFRNGRLLEIPGSFVTIYNRLTIVVDEKGADISLGWKVDQGWQQIYM